METDPIESLEPPSPPKREVEAKLTSSPIEQPWTEWLGEARSAAAQCWRDDETSHIEMNTVLAEAVAKRIAVWMHTTASAYRDADYYRGLVVRCGEAIGEDAYIADDGSESEDVLCAKVPELVEALVGEAKNKTVISIDLTDDQLATIRKNLELAVLGPYSPPESKDPSAPPSGSRPFSAPPPGSHPFSTPR